MRIALAPLNPTVGDVDANAQLIIDAIDAARAARCELVVLPELAVSGYPPRDLVLVEGFVAACMAAADFIGAEHTAGITAVIGTPMTTAGGGVTNSAVVWANGTQIAVYHKRLLPTYGVFDEDRYFEPGDEATVFEVAGRRVGIAICEDLWKGEDVGLSRRYAGQPDPIVALIEAGAQLIVSPTASPFVVGKHYRHHELVRRHATERGVAVLSVNQFGGNDDLIFDGRACAYAAGGGPISSAAFTSDMLIVDPDATQPGACESRSDEAAVIEALTLGVRDYLRKTGHSKALVALSGGIDSALTAAFAVRALGADRVLGVSLPSRFSSDHSVDDAVDLAERLGIELISMPIEPVQSQVGDALDPAFDAIGQRRLGEQLPDVAQENVQSRIRGLLMMALSNRTGALLLTTGNKSELAVGYCTLYGDMNGGLAVLSDVPKTMVYRISRALNDGAASFGFDRPPIPERTISKPPSAELAPGQLDADSLPAYEDLDRIVELHVEENRSAERIIEATGIDADVVRRMCRLIDINEFKRRQLAIGLKVTSIAFGPGRRFPLAQRWVR